MIIHGEFVSENKVVKKYYEMKKKILKLQWNIFFKNNENLLCQL